jgi:hypothetical protein
MPEVLTTVVVVVSGSFVDNSSDVVDVKSVVNTDSVDSYWFIEGDDVSMYTFVAIVDSRILMMFRKEIRVYNKKITDSHYFGA